MTLITFLQTLSTNKQWQARFAKRRQNSQWAQLVNRELSPADAAIVLSEDLVRLRNAVNAEVAAAPAGVTYIVWEGTIVWQ